MSKLTDLEKKFEKQYGKGVIVPASFIEDVKREVISVGPKIDIGLNGGIPTGHWVLLSGLNKVGKTTMALQIAANFQKLGRPVWYIDAENRWKTINLYGVKGFDGDKARVIHSTMDAQLSGEDYLMMALDIFRDPANMGGLMIIDSTSALCPRDVLASGEVSGKRRSTTPKLIKDFIHQARGLVPVMDFTVILIQHLIMNTSGRGKTWLSDGGTELQHQKDVHIQCTRTPVALMDGDKQIGQIVTWDVITSALGPPQSKIESRIRYGYGIDDISENIELAEDFGLIEKGGAWYNLVFMEEPQKFQGMEKVFKFLESRPDILEDLAFKLRMMIIK